MNHHKALLVLYPKNKNEATLKRRIAEAEMAPSPTRAAQKGNPGKSSPGAGISVTSQRTAGAAGKKRAKQLQLTEPVPLQGGWRRDNAGRAAPSGSPRHAVLSPAAAIRGIAIVPTSGGSSTEIYGSSGSASGRESRNHDLILDNADHPM